MTNIRYALQSLISISNRSFYCNQRLKKTRLSCLFASTFAFTAVSSTDYNYYNHYNHYNHYNQSIMTKFALNFWLPTLTYILISKLTQVFYVFYRLYIEVSLCFCLSPSLPSVIIIISSLPTIAGTKQIFVENNTKWKILFSPYWPIRFWKLVKELFRRPSSPRGRSKAI